MKVTLVCCPYHGGLAPEVANRRDYSFRSGPLILLSRLPKTAQFILVYQPAEPSRLLLCPGFGRSQFDDLSIVRGYFAPSVLDQYWSACIRLPYGRMAFYR